MILLARNPGDTANWHPRAEGDLYPSTLPLPDMYTTEKLPRWWAWKSVEELWYAVGGFSHTREQQGGERGGLEVLGTSKGVCREKQGPAQGTRG